MLFVLITLIAIFNSTSAFFHPEYHHKLETKEKIIISLDDDDDDLELITGKQSKLKTNLEEFHEYVRNTKDKVESNPGWNIIKENGENLFKPKLIFRKHEKFKNLSKIKRSEEFEPVVSNLNETDLKSEYEKRILNDLENKVAYNYSDEGKPEENVKESLKKILDVKKPVNCSKSQGFGVKAVECIYADFKNKEMNKKQLTNRIGIILGIWFALYLVITIPSWCIKGWCCCCFRCDLCQPYKSVKNIQKYIAQNPPGVFINSKAEEEHYSASVKETEIYQELNKSIINF